jgi:hypothetical protein
MRKLTFCLLFSFAVASAYSTQAQTEQSKLRFPRIVVQRSEIVSSDTGIIPLTTLVTPENAGLYRISYYWLQTTSPTCPAGPSFCTGQLNLAFYWTDDAGPQSTTRFNFGTFFNSFAPLSSAQPVPVEGQVLARVNAGTPLQYQFYPESTNPQFGNSEGATYEYFFTVEQLQ